MKNAEMQDSSFLWKSFLSGSEQAFSDIYRLYYNDMYAYGVSLGMADFVEDGIQEIFLKLYQKKAEIRNVSRIKSFLFVSLKNYLTNVVIRQNKSVSIHGVEFNFNFQYTIDESLFSGEEKDLLRARIKEMLACLTDRQREAIYLYFLHELDIEEIASLLNMNVQSVRNLLYRALEKVRKTNGGFELIALLIFFFK